MTSPVSVAVLRERAKKVFDRDSRGWAAVGRDTAVLDLPLHPPTERHALATLDATREWVESWREAGRMPGVEVAWSTRNWSRVGDQQLPDRVTVRGTAAIARLAGESAAWNLLSARLDELRGVIGDSEQAVAALRSQARVLADLDPDDFARVADVLAWLRENPESGLRIRELPIRGIHTKWIEARRGLVASLHRAGTGFAGLGLLEPAPSIRMRVLDSSLSLAGLTDVSAPVDDLAALPIRPTRVFVFENLATVLAMPDVRGAVAVHGAGHRVHLVAGLPWARCVTYWGDLDSHGFAILNQLRASGVDATSVLMDADTLAAHHDLWGEDPEPNVGVFPLLDAEERSTLQLLSARGNVRLEQERIPWSYAMTKLGLD